jgi:hypothetical protein
MIAQYMAPELLQGATTYDSKVGGHQPMSYAVGRAHAAP